MKNPTYIIYFAIAILLVGCKTLNTTSVMPEDSQRRNVVTPSLATATVSASLTPIPSETSQVLVTPTQVETGTATQTPAIPSETRLQVQCLDFSSNLPDKTVSNGLVILNSRIVVDGRYQPDTFLLDMATGIASQIDDQYERKFEFRVSPDRKRMAYISNTFDAEGNKVKEELVIEGMDGQRLKVIPWEKGWYTITSWLDNQRLVINIASLDPAESHALKAATLLVLDSFTGERQILRPDFPSIYDYSPIPDWGFWGITMYDPTLTKVVYLRINERGEYEYALWDIKNQQLLASLIYDSQIPRWSPDGSRVVVDGLPKGQNYLPGGKNNFEAFLFDRDGQITQLTNLTPYTDMFLMSYSWSPDGRYIAAWLGSSSLREKKEAELAIVDITTRQVTNYCIRVKYGQEVYGEAPLTPIWSPDSTQLIIQDLYETYHRRVILVDLDRSMAAQIAEDMEPVGWMVAP